MFGDNLVYTHYFEFLMPSGRSAASLEKCYQKAIKDCAKIIREYNNMYDKGSSERLSGYTAHTTTYGGIVMNGRLPLTGDNFILREHFKQNFERGDDIGTYNFKNGLHCCKTREYPYDIVVVACLAVLKQKLGNAIRVTSDGEAEDFQLGTELARRILKRKIANPLGEVFKDRFEKVVNE